MLALVRLQHFLPYLIYLPTVLEQQIETLPGVPAIRNLDTLDENWKRQVY